MFGYIFQECKNNIYCKNNFRKFKDFNCKEKISLIVLVALSLLYIGFMFCSKIIGATVVLIFLMADVIFIISTIGNNWSNSNLIYMKKYKEEKIEKIINILKIKDISMYDQESLKWLIKMCDKEIEKIRVDSTSNFLNPIKGFFTMIIYPILVSVSAIVIKDMAPEDVLTLAITIIGLLLMIFILGYMIYPVVDEYINKTSKILIAFKQDLEYILLKCDK